MKYFIVTVIVFGALISTYTYQNAKDDTITSLVSRADTIAQLVDEKDLSSLVYSEQDLANPIYTKIKTQFINARMVNPDVRFIYIFVIEDGIMKFVVDSEPSDSDNYSPPGQEYEEADQQPEILNVFTTGTSIVQDAYADRWGTWVTGLSPIKDANGKVKYVVGMDINASSFTMKPYLEATFPSMLSLLLIALAFTVYVIRKKEMELVQTKAQFISVASHELRSPLTGIRWSAENLLGSGDLSDDKKTVIKAIQDSSINLLSIVNDLLSISVAEHDFIDKKSFVILDVRVLVQSVIEDHSATARSVDVTVSYDTLQEPLMVKGNANRLKNIFSNLISNAIKYSKKGGSVSVSIGMHTNFKKKYVRVVVRDTGIGIPKDDIKKVSKGFFRAENAKIHTAGGTGLGLYISHKIADFHGGSLAIDSLEGKGTMVTVSLPFCDK